MSKEDIQKLNEELKSLEIRVQENEIIIESQEIQKSSLLKNLQPKYLDLKSQEKTLEKKLQHLNDELSKRKDLENAFVRSLELGSKAKASVKIDNQNAIMNVLSNLKSWDSIPDIVKKHLDEQEHIFETKKVFSKKAELSLLQERLQSRRKSAIKTLTIKLKSDKSLWESEWEHKIDTESTILKSTYEKQLSDLQFQKRLLEISLYKFTQK
ncbi:hypothetical protein SteCoe_23453 [Stentor coeruleus]|uniref:Uncharacterized protein n=1 Tax=Stentor coeruleus TaxID=5963 RepID=A0A1R2BJU9_9CILI|nr:hypothetical protein SteCoe_23453 [Stentor coeruleus]